MLLRATIHKDSSFVFVFFFLCTDTLMMRGKSRIPLSPLYLLKPVSQGFAYELKVKKNGLKQALQHLAFLITAYHAPGVCTMAFYWRVIADELA